MIKYGVVLEQDEKEKLEKNASLITEIDKKCGKTPEKILVQNRRITNEESSRTQA